MNIEEAKHFLKGESFSNSLVLSISKKESSIKYRIPQIESIIRDKNIIHVGCVDHLPLIEQKRKQGSWLHERIDKICSSCLGVDINQEGIDYMKNNGFNNIYLLNIVEDPVPDAISSRKWDYMLLGELLEHVDNPVEFLKNIKVKYENYVDKLIITVPNAFRLYNYDALKKHQEWINSDHRYWFSPYTLSKVSVCSGFEVESFSFAQIGRINWKSIRKRYLLTRYPALRDCIVMTLKFA